MASISEGVFGSTYHALRQASPSFGVGFGKVDQIQNAGGSQVFGQDLPKDVQASKDSSDGVLDLMFLKDGHIYGLIMSIFVV